MCPEPKQLDLFDRVPSKDDQVILQPGSPEENEAVESHARSPTWEDPDVAIRRKSKERGDRLREMSRALSLKRHQPGINQD